MRYKGFNKITFVIFSILFLLLVFITARTPFEISKPMVLKGWQQKTDWEKYTYTATRIIDRQMCGRSVSFISHSAYVDVLLEDENVYHFGKTPKFGKSPGTYQHFIDIPMDAEGKLLTIHMKYPEKKAICDSYEFLCGDSASIVRYLLKQDLFSLIASVFMILFSVVLVILHIIGKKSAREESQNIWLGLLILDFCLWSNSKSFISQMIFQNSLLQFYANFYFFFLLPFLLINYLKEVFSKLRAALEYLGCLLGLLICVILHFLNIWDLRHSSRVFAFVMFMTFVSLLYKIVIPIYKKHEWTMANGLLVFIMLCFIWNSINVCIGKQNSEKSFVVQLGLLVYMVVALFCGAKKLIVSAEESRAAEVYKEMAYTDNLTKLQNRHALRKNVEKMQLKDICVVSMDLNNLKYYNDNLGHAYGDKLIQEAARVIRETYKDAYRTGGDEFVAIMQKVTREQAESCRDQLIRSWKQFNESQDELVLEIACGNGFYCVGDESYEDIMKRADDNMYYDKAYLKKHSKIQSSR